MKSNLLVDTERAIELKANSTECASYHLARNQIHELELLIAGFYYPLSGYLNESDHGSVIKSMHLTDGTLWAKPISLAVDNNLYTSLNRGDQLALRDQEGALHPPHARGRDDDSGGQGWLVEVRLQRG